MSTLNTYHFLQCAKQVLVPPATKLRVGGFSSLSDPMDEYHSILVMTLYHRHVG